MDSPGIVLLYEWAPALIGISWAVMGIIFFLFNPNKTGSEKGYALIMLVSLMLPLFQVFFGYLYPGSGLLNILEIHSLPMLHGPAFFLYTLKILNVPGKGRISKLIHFVPFLIFIIIETLVKQGSMPVQGFSPFIYLHSAAGAVSVLCYGALVFRKVMEHQKRVDNLFSSREAEITLSWLRILSVGYMVIFGFSFFLLLVLGHEQDSKNLISLRLITLSSLDLFIIYFSYFGSRQTIITVNPSMDDREEQNEQKYEKSSLSDGELEDISQKLTTYMKESRAYLDENLTLEKLSLLTEITRHKISQTLNREMDRTFYSFVNNYRIAEFENLVRRGKHNSLSMLGMAYECGFKSSSSFYNALKKEKGKTPKQIIRDNSA